MKGVKYKGKVLCFPHCFIKCYTGGGDKSVQTLNQSDEFEKIPRCEWCGKLHDYVTLVKDGKKLVME